MRKRYGVIKPKMYIYYDRVSYKGIKDKKVRLTIDKNLLYRDYNVNVMVGKFGKALLDPKKVIMEIKDSRGTSRLVVLTCWKNTISKNNRFQNMAMLIS